jgi:hypothetical protein
MTTIESQTYEDSVRVRYLLGIIDAMDAIELLYLNQGDAFSVEGCVALLDLELEKAQRLLFAVRLLRVIKEAGDEVRKQVPCSG